MPKKYIASMKDIARESGVSISTVSRVLQRKSVISDETSSRVMNAAMRVGYRSNLLIEGIKTGRTRTIGVVMPLGDPFFAAMACGIHRKLQEYDYTMMVLWPEPDGHDELAQIHRLMERRVEGIIVRPVYDEASDDYFQEVIDSGVPLVTVDRDLPRAQVSYVGSDDYCGGRMGADYLLRLGHRHIGYIPGLQHASTGRLRFRGVLDRLQEQPDAVPLVFPLESFYTGNVAEIADYIVAHPEMTAVFTSNDFVAVAVMQAARLTGIKIPEQLSVLGYSGILDKVTSPRLTTIDQHPRKIGCRAVELLFRHLDDSGDQRREKILIPPTLQVRESCVGLKSVTVN